MSLITKEIYDDPKNQEVAVRIRMAIAQRLLQAGIQPGINVPLAAYLLCKVAQDGTRSENAMQDVFEGRRGISADTLHFIQNQIPGEVWEQLLPIANGCTAEGLELAALLPECEDEMKLATATPQSILTLVQHLLDVQPDEYVGDLCCGSGSGLVSFAMSQPNAHYFGYEINEDRGRIAWARADLLSSNVQVKIDDVFRLADDKSTPKFDKIFSNYPFGMRLRYLGDDSNYMERLTERYPGLSKATSSDWIFNALLCELLAKNGKAIGIMTNGSTWNSTDTPMRKYFVERKMIECVISLPVKMFPYTNIGTTLIVFSHNNDTVRMIDATEIYHKGRRQNVFSTDDIAAVLDALHTDSDYSKSVTLDELRTNEYNLRLERYVQKAPTFENGVPFEDIIKSITRGAPCTANQLDEMVSNEVTNMQYLMLANIQDGIIDDKLPYLSTIEPKYEKYCLKNNDLILSKNGYPYKVAVASVKEGQRILANGNLYIIELDESRANPYYIKAFFDSEQGAAALKSITVGATIPNIGVDKLKNIMIPLPSMEEQLRVAQKYQETLDEVVMLKLRLEQVVNKLHHVFDDESEETTA